MKKFALMMALAMPLAFASCTSEESEPIALDKNVATIDYKATTTIVASDSKVNWSSSDEFVATVDANGVVTGKHVGTATIIASKDGESASCKVTVEPIYNTYELPLIAWNSTVAQIKAAVPSTLGLAGEGDGYLIYQTGKTGNFEAYPVWSYVFYQNALISSSITVADTELDNLMDQVEQYYVQLKEASDNEYIYGNASTLAASSNIMTISFDADNNEVIADFEPNDGESALRAAHIKSVRNKVRAARK